MSDITDPAAAKAALQQLLDSIEDRLGAAGAPGSPAYAAAVSSAQGELQAFVDSTKADLTKPQEVAAMRAIDQVARDLLLDLTLEAMEGQLAKIREGAERLRALGNQLGEQADRNQAAAASIGLKPVKDAVDEMTGMVESVKALKTNLKADKPDEAAIAAEIDRLVTQFESLRKAVRSAGG